jgi:RNA polymerase subunit RPABC4/transcription elongation factor Spt4
MVDGKCACGREGEAGACAVCGGRDTPGYWCDGCGRAVPEKRCPLCGLKARKMRGKGEGA